MVAIALLCAAAREAAGQTELNVQLTRVTPDFAGFIRVQGGRFVDAQCSVFPVVGLNACAPTSNKLFAFCRPVSFAERQKVFA